MRKVALRFSPDRLKRLLAAGLFAVAFGWLEAVIVVYLRKLIGLEGALDAMDPKTQEALLENFATMRSKGPGSFLSPEFFLIEQSREVATMLMLLAFGYLAAGTWRQRAAYFFFAFGVWDIVYYAALWILVRWPQSPQTLDILFLIPFPWIAQVWIPIAISFVFIGGAVWSLRGPRRR